MAVILEVKSGPMVGKKIPVQKGQVVSFGRTDKANVAFPHDDKMSRLHCTVEFGASGARVVDRGSSNGTFVNGSKISDTLVVNNDEIRAGDTILVVRIVADDQPARVDASSQVPSAAPGAHADVTVKDRGAQPGAGRPMAPAPAPFAHAAPPAAMPHPQPPPAPRPPEPAAPRPAPPPPPPPAPSAAAPAVVAGAVRIGSWVFSKVPRGWEVQEGFGITYAGKDGFPSSIVATEEPLMGGMGLQQYVEAQVNMMREYLREPTIEPAVAPRIAGAEDVVVLEVRYTTAKDRSAIFYRRIYARAGDRVAVLTLTTLESELSKFQPVFSEIVASVALERKAEAS